MLRAMEMNRSAADLRARLSDAGLFAKKGFGQHFLLDPGLLDRIASIAAPLAGRTVLEIGPGPGGLSMALIAAGARVIAVEKDPRFAEFLADLEADSGGAFRVVLGDALDIDEAALLAEETPPAVIVANLPYNVATPLLVKWLKAPTTWRGPMALMFQKEVAQRIVAKPGHDAYGRLAVLAQSACSARLALTLAPGAFSPPPKVASAVVRLDPLAAPFGDLDGLEKVTAAAFGQRRKMLRSSLVRLGDPEALCAQAGIPATARAEEIDIAGFQRLTLAVTSA
jgi:16S rRNA (adenine1518-N6/adenine1519-N6)-dimethyltransferase